MKFLSSLKCIVTGILILTSFSLAVKGRAQTIVDRIIRKDSNLVVYTQKDSDKYVIAVAIDRHTHVSYLISCYGQVVDSVHIADADYALLQQKQVTPFEYYNTVYDNVLRVADAAREQLRTDGKVNPKWKYAGMTKDLLPASKTNQSILQKLIRLDELSESYTVLKWLLNNPNPRNLKQNSSTLYMDYDRGKAGTRLIGKDSTIYYNVSSLSVICKAVLVNREAKVYYWDRSNVTYDSLLLNPERVDTILKQKTDLFLLYRVWLERQRQSIEQGIRILDSVRNVQPNVLVHFTDRHTSDINDLFLQARQSLNRIAEKIAVVSLPDAKAIATIYHQRFKYLNVHTALFSSLRLPYTASIFRGTRRYELTDHRGNVMAVVSDRKVGVDEDEDGKIDYYKAVVVSATDYYSFGKAMPGRNTGNYRYGFNGKENDGDIKRGVQDYGERVSDQDLGRFFSVDPLTKEYAELTPYQFASNSPIENIDLDGLEAFSAIVNGRKKTVYGPYTFEGAAKALGTNPSNIINSYAFMRAGFLKLSTYNTIKKQVSTTSALTTRRILDRIYDREGREAEDVRGDAGGLTKFGIAKNREWGKASKLLGLEQSDNNLRNMTEIQADKYYLETRLEPYSINKIGSEQLAYALFDQSLLTPSIINTNLKASINQVAGTNYKLDNSRLTEEQVATLNSSDTQAVLNAFLERQAQHYKTGVSKEKQARFLKGWLNRLDSIKTYKAQIN